MVRQIKIARDTAVKARSSAIIALKALIVNAPGELRETLETVEFATLGLVDWFNHRRLLGPIGHVSPAEFEQQYYLVQEAPVIAAGVNL